MKIRHDVFMATMILTLGISSIAANTSQSQTADSIPPRDTQLLERLKTLNDIEEQQKEKKEQLFTGLDSSIIKVKKLAESKNETGKIMDETRWMLNKLSVKKIPARQRDTLLFLLPKIEVAIPVARIELPDPTPQAAVERVKRQTWLNRIFNFL